MIKYTLEKQIESEKKHLFVQGEGREGQLAQLAWARPRREKEEGWLTQGGKRRKGELREEKEEGGEERKKKKKKENKHKTKKK